MKTGARRRAPVRWMAQHGMCMPSKGRQLLAPRLLQVPARCVQVVCVFVLRSPPRSGVPESVVAVR